MPKYLLSVHSVEGAPRQPMTDDEMKKMMTDVRTLEDDMKSTGAFVFGGRLEPAQSAAVVRVADGETLRTDGPFAETKEHLGGFYILEAEDVAAALMWASRTADCVRTSIELRGFWEEGQS
jgi:hypothetical protein